MEPHRVAAADLNNDGKLDIISTDHIGDGISILMNTGGGVFEPAVSYYSGDGPKSALPADFDGDGDLDLIVANMRSNSFTYFANDGNGLLTAVTVPASYGQAPSYALPVDVDNDGDPDIVSGDLGGNSIHILLNDGLANFGGGGYLQTLETPYFIYAGNLNADNWIDLAVANYSANKVSVFLGTNSDAPDTIAPAAVTNLAPKPNDTTSVKLSWMAPGDDGWLGLASQYDIRYSTSPLTDANWNAATPAVNSIIPGAPEQMQSGIVSGLPRGHNIYLAMKAGDEVPNYSGISNVVMVYLAEGPFSTICGDCNGDNKINIQDITRLINYLWRDGTAPNPWQVCDVNSNGILNIQDVTRLINYLYKGGPAPQCL
jgi:hypothetical protein